MKILVLSNTPWSNDNSFGNSFSNIFRGIEGLEFANIYCRYGAPHNEIVKKYFQITEKSILANLKNSRCPSGKEVFEAEQYFSLDKSEEKLLNHVRKNRLQIFFWARNLIWQIGRWKSSELKKFITEFDPDIIFQPVYYSTYINNIALFIKELTNVPMVCYVSDDVYTLRQFSLSPLYWINRFIIRRRVKKVIESCEHLYVISDIQKREYEKCFNKDCRVLTKGADFSGEPPLKEKYNNPIKLVYTGNIGGGRWKTLAMIGEALDNINNNGTKAQLDIYTLTPFTNTMRNKLDDGKNIFLKGSLTASQVTDVQEAADILVHVESFERKYLLEARLSFSTKIVDYLHQARCIFAVGSHECASIDYIEANDAGIVAVDEKEIYNKLRMLVDMPTVVRDYGYKAYACGSKNHQSKKIKEMLKSDLFSVINNTSENSSAFSKPCAGKR